MIEHRNAYGFPTTTRAITMTQSAATYRAQRIADDYRGLDDRDPDGLTPEEVGHIARIAEGVHDACGRDLFGLSQDDTAHLVEEMLYTIGHMLRHGAGRILLPEVGTLEAVDHPDGRLLSVLFTPDDRLFEEVSP